MKRLALAVLMLAVTGLAKQIDGSKHPEQIPDEVAYTQLMYLLTEDGSPRSKESIQAFCDYQLKLTQPEKEELLQKVEKFNQIDKDLLKELAKEETTADQANNLKIYRKNLGKSMALEFTAKDKLDKVLPDIKLGTIIDDEEGQ